jgi:hypothetical protein
MGKIICVNKYCVGIAVFTFAEEVHSASTDSSTAQRILIVIYSNLTS